VALSKQTKAAVGGSAVVLLAPVDGWRSGAVASPARSGRHGRRHLETEGETGQ
jgi:hypothetical protein